MLTHAHKWMDVCTSRTTDTNFESNQSQAMSYNPSFKSISGSVFELKSRNRILIWRPPCFSKWHKLLKQPSLDGALNHPVKFQIDWLKCLRVRVWEGNSRWQPSCGTNFVSNLAWMVPYHPVTFQNDRQQHLRVRAWKWNFKMAAIVAIFIF